MTLKENYTKELRAEIELANTLEQYVTISFNDFNWINITKICNIWFKKKLIKLL